MLMFEVKGDLLVYAVCLLQVSILFPDHIRSLFARLDYYSLLIIHFIMKALSIWKSVSS